MQANEAAHCRVCHTAASVINKQLFVVVLPNAALCKLCIEHLLPCCALTSCTSHTLEGLEISVVFLQHMQHALIQRQHQHLSHYFKTE